MKGIQAAKTPGSKDRSECHLCRCACGRLGTAADLATGDHMAQTSLRGVVGRRDLRITDKDEEFLLVFVDASTQFSLDRERIVKEGTTHCEQTLFQGPLFDLPLTLVGVLKRQPFVKEREDAGDPRGQTCVGGIDFSQVVDVAEKMCPTALMKARIMMVGSIEVTDQGAGECGAKNFIDHVLGPASA